MNPEPQDLMTLQQALLAGIVGLTGALGILWKIVSDNFKDLRKRAADCETDRAKLWKALAGRAGATE